MTGTRQPYTDGRFAGTGPVLGVRDPATDEQIAEVGTNTPAEIERAVLAARRAFDAGEWPRLALAERVAVLARMPTTWTRIARN
jgi:acyl-CoA reductase-like NAD-dependent aldehyde dehydrogenase